MGVRVLITGGAGYLGTLLSKKLCDKGYEVRVIDALWYGKEPLKELINQKNFEIICADIRDLTKTIKSMKDVDAVIHLASIVGMPASSIEPRTSEEINYLATKNIAELCTLHNISTYIFASTCSVYGIQSDSIITEKSPTTPLDFYSKQKWVSERAILWLNRAPTILRFATLFGLSPRMRFDLVVNLFIAQSILEGKITVHGGDQNRPFLHVTDAADSVIFSLENNLTGTYNVVSENLSIMDVAKKISKLSNCEIEVSNENPDKRNYTVSGEKMKQIGFSTEKRIEDAFNEIKGVIDNGEFKDYQNPKYNNYKFLTNSKAMKDKVFIQGFE